MKFTIIGAGPAGSYSAYLLARAGHDVSVYEEQKEIGRPWACTGVITADVLNRRVKFPKEVVINKIEKARIISPGGEKVELKLKNDIIVDRVKMDQHMAEKAKDAGAKYHVNHKFVKVEKNGSTVVASIKNKNLGTKLMVHADYLIGADGPRSEVAKQVGLFGDRKFYVGSQVTANQENDNVIDFYPSEAGIAWTVPENKSVVRAGIAANRNAGAFFNGFLEKSLGKEYKKKITGHQAGSIPVYNGKSKSQNNHVMLAGDAAGMVKATTLGGINQSLMAAEAISESINGEGDYTKLWRKKLHRDLWIALMMRKAMNKFSDEEYDKLVKIFNADKNKRVLEQFDRDEPRKFALKLLIKEPRLLFLSRKVLF